MLVSRTFRSMVILTLGILILLPNLSLAFTKTIPLVCANSFRPDNLLEVSYELTATPLGPVIEGEPVDIEFTGVGFFSAELLNGALQEIPGLDEIRADSMNATVAVRSGAVGDTALLNPTTTLPQVFPITIVEDPAVCAAAGYPTSRCVLEPIVLPLTTETRTLVPDAAGTDILLGWDESEIPPVSIDINSPGPNGARAAIRILIWIRMGLECYMASLNDNGTPEDPADNFAEPLPDSALLAIPVESDPTGIDDTPLASRALGVRAAPNPFNPSTTVFYSVPNSGKVRLDVFTARGSLIKNLVNEYMEAGTHRVSWNGTDGNGKRMPSGVYFMRIGSKTGFASSKMVIVK